FWRCFTYECSRRSLLLFFFSSRRRHTRWPRDWSSDVCSSDLGAFIQITYDDQEGAFGIDNMDFRFADVANFSGHSLIYGASLNRSEERRVGKECRTWWSA